MCNKKNKSYWPDLYVNLIKSNEKFSFCLVKF